MSRKENCIINGVTIQKKQFKTISLGLVFFKKRNMLTRKITILIKRKQKQDFSRPKLKKSIDIEGKINVPLKYREISFRVKLEIKQW